MVYLPTFTIGNPTKCRLIYHTWMVWLIIPSTSTQPSPAFRWCLPPPRPLPKPKLREPDAVLLVPCPGGFFSPVGLWWMGGVYAWLVPPVPSLMLFFLPWEIEGGFMMRLYYCNDWNGWMNWFMWWFLIDQKWGAMTSGPVAWSFNNKNCIQQVIPLCGSTNS